MQKVPKNQKHKSDIEQSVEVTRIELNLIGLWPSVSADSILKKCRTILLKFISQFLLYFTLIPGLLEMILTDFSPQMLLRRFGPLFFCMVGIAKYTILLFRDKDIRRCVEHMEYDWRNIRHPNDRKIMMEFARFGRSLAVIYTIFIYVSGFSQRAIVPLLREPIVINNVSLKPTPFPGKYLIFNPQISPGYEVVWTLQFMGGFVQYFVTGGAVSLAATLVFHACGQLKLLMTNMEDLTAGEDQPRKAKDPLLTFVVERHMRIKSFLPLVENTLHHLCLVEVMGCTVILCLLGYYIIIAWKDGDFLVVLTYSILVVNFTFNIFILCFIGEILNDQGMKVHLTACTLKWYRLPDQTVKSLILVVAMASAPINITAGKFMNLSLNSFGAIIRTSIAYLNMLRATTL